MLPDAFGKNHATILGILKMRGALRGNELKTEIYDLNKMKRGLGMSMSSQPKVMRELIKWKMITKRKEGRGKGCIYSITQKGEKALLEQKKGNVVISRKFSYDFGFKNFGVADVRVYLPFQSYPTHIPFSEEAVIEPMEELCNEVLESWHKYFPNQPVDVSLEVKMNSEAIDEDVFYFRKELFEVQDKVRLLHDKWCEEVGLDSIFDQHGLFRYAFEVVVCEEELKERGIQPTLKNYLKIKEPIMAKVKKGDLLSDLFYFSINGKTVDFRDHLMKKHYTILNNLKQPKIKRWICKYRKNLNDWFPDIPWNDLGFPSKVTPSPCALPKNLFIPMKEQNYDTNVRMLLHFLARLSIEKALGHWNFYFQNIPMAERFDDHAFLVTYHLVKRELKNPKMPEDIRVQVSRVGTTRTFETGPTTFVLPGRQISIDKMWVFERKLTSSEIDFFDSKIEVDNWLSQKMPSRAKKLKIFKLFDTIYRRWERAGKPINRSRQIFRLLKDFLGTYKHLTEEKNFNSERALDEAARLMETKAESITF